MNLIDKFIVLVSFDKIKKADAIIYLEGDGYNRLDKVFELYNNGYSGDNLIKYINNKLENNYNKYSFLFTIDIYKKEIRNETLIILFCLNFIYFRNNIDIKNIRFM